jgi:PhnB protein
MKKESNMTKLYINPYINFQGRTREAMEFYHQVFGGKLNLVAFNETGAPKAAGPDDRVMHSHLEADGVVLMATDGSPDYPPTVGDHMAIAAGGTDKERLTKIFNDLAEGGVVKMPLAPQAWGSELGYLADRFGINWTVSIDKE